MTPLTGDGAAPFTNTPEFAAQPIKLATSSLDVAYSDI